MILEKEGMSKTLKVMVVVPLEIFEAYGGQLRVCSSSVNVANHLIITLYKGTEA